MSLKERIICKLCNLLKVPVNRALILLDRVRDLDFNRSVICRINGCYYYECTHLRTHGMLRKTGEEATGRDALLDVGCGKGRMLWFFSRCPFGRVDGIEHNPRIADIAERNLQKLRVRSRVFRMDARDFTRWQDYNWFYFTIPSRIG